MALAACVLSTLLFTNIILINSENQTTSPFLDSWISTSSPDIAGDGANESKNEGKWLDETTAGKTLSQQHTEVTEASVHTSDQPVTANTTWNLPTIRHDQNTELTTDNLYTQPLETVTTDGTTDSQQISLSRKSNKRGLESCRRYNYIILGVLSIIISVVGIISNSLCVLVFWPDRNKSASTVLLLQLSIVDSLVLVVWSVMLMVTAEVYYSGPPSQGLMDVYPYIYKFGWGSANIVQMVACWLIVVITVQRYVAVCHPHKMRLVSRVRVAWIQLLILSVVSILFNIPRFLETNIVTLKNGKAQIKDSWLGTNEAYLIYYKGIAFYVVIFILPVALLIFFTVSLIRQLKKSKVKVNPAQAAQAGTAAAGQKASSTKDDVTFAVIVVDIVFICCQLINPLRRFTDVFMTREDRDCGKPYSYFTPWTGLGIFVNSAINFLIFCLCGKGFRSQVIHRLRKTINPQAVEPSNTMNPTARTNLSRNPPAKSNVAQDNN